MVGTGRWFAHAVVGAALLALPAHAQNALARVSQHGTSAEKAKVRAAVHRKYPSMGKGKTGKLSSMLRAKA